jgi:hypothetical protein
MLCIYLPIVIIFFIYLKIPAAAGRQEKHILKMSPSLITQRSKQVPGRLPGTVLPQGRLITFSTLLPVDK